MTGKSAGEMALCVALQEGDGSPTLAVYSRLKEVMGYRGH